ncbi:MAG TPA: hypothetical protein VFV96_03790 [Verrucomicrobiae bacterium]|nr:hypothetical protein [Verrucomicrobiae bacterium]
MNTFVKMMLRPARAQEFRSHNPCDRRAAGLKTPMPEGVPLADAVRIQAAEFWLALGLADQAARELEALPAATACHPWTLRTQLTIVSALCLH